MLGTFEPQLSEDRLRFRIKVTPDGGEPATFEGEACDLSDVIEELGKLRAQMTDPVAETLEPSTRMPGGRLSGWRVSPHPDGKALGLRHKGFGWQAWIMSQEKADEIADLLKQRSGIFAAPGRE